MYSNFLFIIISFFFCGFIIGQDLSINLNNRLNHLANNEVSNKNSFGGSLGVEYLSKRKIIFGVNFLLNNYAFQTESLLFGCDLQNQILTKNSVAYIKHTDLYISVPIGVQILKKQKVYMSSGVEFMIPINRSHNSKLLECGDHNLSYDISSDISNNSFIVSPFSKFGLNLSPKKIKLGLLIGFFMNKFDFSHSFQINQIKARNYFVGFFLEKKIFNIK